MNHYIWTAGDSASSADPLGVTYSSTGDIVLRLPDASEMRLTRRQAMWLSEALVDAVAATAPEQMGH